MGHGLGVARLNIPPVKPEHLTVRTARVFDERWLDSSGLDWWRIATAMDEHAAEGPQTVGPNRFPVGLLGQGND